jgi:hypothetical protein
VSEPPRTPSGGDGRVTLDGPLGPLELIIHEDGSVTFVDLSPELLDIAHALNPDDPLICERRALLSVAAVDASEPPASPSVD